MISGKWLSIRYDQIKICHLKSKLHRDGLHTEIEILIWKINQCIIMLDCEHMTVTNETMTFMVKMLSFQTLCVICHTNS